MNFMATYWEKECFLLTLLAFCDGRAGFYLPFLSFTFSGCVGDSIFEPQQGAVSLQVLFSIICLDIFLGESLMSVSSDQILIIFQSLSWKVGFRLLACWVPSLGKGLGFSEFRM